MSSVWNSLARFMPFGGRKLAGKDLLGNKYYEYPNPTGGRMRRVVKYRFMTKMSDYTSGQHRLPIQWTSWLSHTRQNPPSIQELEKDAKRQYGLVDKIAEIESREKEERLRQGYISSLDDMSDSIHSSSRFGALGTKRIESGGLRKDSSFADRLPSPPPPPSSNTSKPQSATSTGTPSRGDVPDSIPGPSQLTFAPEPPINRPNPPTALDGENVYQVPTPHSPSIPPPSETVDPSSHASKDELRKLAEEDTMRRIKQAGGEVKTSDDGVKNVGVGSEGLKPRRRARA